MDSTTPSERPRPRPNALGRMWRRLGRAFLPPASTGGPSGFAHLLKLEDRTLPSATPLGTEFLINQSVAGTHQTTAHPTRSVAVNPTNGNYVVTWTSVNANANGQSVSDVYARLYSAAGTPLTGEFQVNPTSLENSVTPAVAMDGSGNFVITWASDNQNSSGNWGVYCRYYNSQGNPQGQPYAVASTAASDEQNPTIAMDAKGAFVIAWTSDRTGGPTVYAERFKNGGAPVGAAFRVNTTTAGNQSEPAAAMDANGDFVIAWLSNQNGGQQVFAQDYHADGGKVGSETQVSTGGTNQQDPAVAMDASGAYTVLWSSNQGLLFRDIYGRQFKTDGNPLAAEFPVASYLLGDSRWPSIDVGPGGNYLVSWSVNGEDALGTWGVYAQEMSPSGSLLGSPFPVNTTTAGDQQYSSVAANAAGQAIIVWSGNGVGDPSGVFGRRVALSDLVVSPTAGLVTTEAGGTAMFQVALAVKPTGNVTIALNSSDPTQGTPSSSTLTFTPSNWSQPQTVTVTGQDDHIVNGDQTYTVNLAASSTDPNYNGAQAAVGLTNLERDVAGLTVTPSSGLVTTEAGGSARFTVALTSEPVAPVILNVATSDAVQGTPDVANLTFDATDWSTPQTVTVTGHDDHIVNGDQTYTIDLTAASADPNYAGRSAAVALTNREADVAGITVTPTAGLVTTSAGGSATFQVVLTSEPIADVVIPLSSSDTLEGTVGTPSLTFTAGNWNTPQVVTVTGRNDGLPGNSPVPYTIVTAPAVSTDPNYGSLNAPDVAVVNDKLAAPAIVVTPTGNLVTTEAGGTAQFTVVLQTQPTAGVTIGLHSTDPQAGTVVPSSLTFTPSDWNVPQTVTVTGQDDHVVTGDVAYQVVTDPAVSADPAYNGLNAPDVSLTNTEEDVAGFVVTPTSGLVTTEAGGAATFRVTLTSKPVANVIIGLSSSDPSAGTPSVPQLTFTPADWNLPQSVTVTGVDDHVITGDTYYTIVTAPASSADPVYNGLKASDVLVLNREMDVAGILVTPTAGLTTSAGGTASFSVRLATQPSGDVQVYFSSSDPAAGTPTVTSVVLTPSDWNAPQPVVVVGGQGGGASLTYTIVTAPAVSTDAHYNGLDPADVSVVWAPAPSTPTPGPVPAPQPVPPPPVVPEPPPPSPGQNGNAPPVPAGPPQALVVAAATVAAPGVPANGPVEQLVARAVSRPADPAGGGGQAPAIALSGPGGRDQSIHLVGAAASASIAPGSVAALPRADLQRFTFVLPWSSPAARPADAGTEEVVLRPAGPPDATAARPEETAEVPPGAAAAEGLPPLVLREAREEPTTVPAPAGMSREVTAVVGTGLLASTGYLLLNTRAGLWLLGLFMAKPLWKEFDPLEVLYAWEREEMARGTEDGETLLTLVE
jgi:hypothetical protein